jgi:hypothetical protein
MVKGKGHHVTVNTAQSGAVVTSTEGAQPEPEPGSPRWKRWAKLGGFIVGLAGIVGAVAGVIQVLG